MPQADHSITICLDLRYRTESGGSTYVKQLAAHLLRVDMRNRYVLAKYRGQRFDFESRAAQVIIVPRMPIPLDVLWNNLVLPFVLRRRGVDVYHPLKWPVPLWNTAVNVRTMHIPHHNDRGENPASFGMRAFLWLYGNRTFKRVRAIVAVSHYLEEVLHERHGVPAGRVHVIYHGIDPAFQPLPPETIAPTLERLGLTPGYVLCVGNVTGIKNHITVVKALACLPEGLRRPLVIAGATQHRNSVYARVQRTAAELGVAARVKFPGFVSPADVVALLNGASIMVMPSLQEGFGLALMEAFKCGTPVISTASGPLDELARGRALILENPLDHLQLANLLERLLASPQLRSELSARELAFARDFTWEKSALAHVRVYEDCARAEL